MKYAEIHTFPSHQILGIIQYTFPEEKGRGPRVTFQDWKEQLELAYSRSHPYVVREGEYSKQGVREKLHASKGILEKLLEIGALRIDEASSRATQKCIDPLSIAQTISALYHLPTEDILIKQSPYSPVANISPEHHLRKLWNAYTGERWFETFRSSVCQKIQDLSPIREWQIIPRNSVHKILKISRNTARELEEHEFIIPKEKEFKNRSLHNFVDQRSFAYFIALLKGKHIQNTFIQKENDLYYQDIRALFINKRILPYLRKHELQPRCDYTISELSEKLNITANAIRSYLFTMHSLPFTRAPYQKNRVRVVIKGIDIALHQLKGERKKQYGVAEITSLFGIPQNHFEKLRLPSSGKDLYGTQQWVYPLYDTLTSGIRERFLLERNTNF